MTGLIRTARFIQEGSMVPIHYAEKLIDSDLSEALWAQISDGRGYSVWTSRFCWEPTSPPSGDRKLARYLLVALTNIAEVHVGEHCTSAAMLHYAKATGRFERHEILMDIYRFDLWLRIE